jgi:predicted Zn-dependent protease
VRNARIGQLLASALGAAAAVATGSGELGTAVMAGGATLGGYSIASFSRSEEQSADQAAVSYLERTGIGAQGLAEFFRILDRQQLLTGQRETAYLRTHPFSRDRLTFVERHVAQGGAVAGLDAAAHERHARMVAKLVGFLELPSRAAAEFAGRDDIAGRYGHAIATFRLNDVPGALRELDALLREEPDNPYFHELKGQILFETGQVEAAVAPYREAVRLAPDAALLQLGYGRALLESGRPEAAVGPLEAVVRAEPGNAFAWRTLGIAHGRAGDMGASNLALAEAALLTGDVDDAGLFLARADKLVDAGPERRRLQDLQRSLERTRDDR